MAHDPLAVIAESYKTIADTQQILAQTQLRMEETARDIAQTQRLGFRLQGFALRLQACALGLIGLSLLGTGFLIWQHVAQRQETAALNQAVLHNTQIIAAQTQAILERMGPR